MSIQDKLNKHYPVKSIQFKIDDIDEGTRKVKGYASAFDVMDSDNDVIRKGAFLKSIQERGPESAGNRKIAHLRNHDWEHQIGKFVELYEDEKGLVFVSELGRSTKGTDALLDYQDGILREHSIGFNYVKDKINFIEADKSGFDSQAGHFEITEVKLWENSGVTFGANEFTPVLEVAKDAEGRDQLIQKLNELSERFQKTLRNGGGTDERLQNLELTFKQIQELQNSLIASKPSIKDTLDKNKPNNSVNLEEKLFWISQINKF